VLVPCWFRSFRNPPTFGEQEAVHRLHNNNNSAHRKTRGLSDIELAKILNPEEGKRNRQFSDFAKPVYDSPLVEIRPLGRKLP
jgi:hypothetical protein